MTGQATKKLEVVEKRKPPAAGMGRPKGVLNKTTRQLKEAILLAAEQAGGREGLVGYLKGLAVDHPNSFAPLLGKVLPLTLQGTGPDGEHVVRVEIVGVAPTQIIDIAA